MHWMLAVFDTHVAGECLAVISSIDLDCSTCEIPCISVSVVVCIFLIDHRSRKSV